MRATVLHQGQYIPDPVDPSNFGEFVEVQDPLTGEIVRVWKPFPVTPDDPATPDTNEETFEEIRCIARGIVDGGIRVAGTTERFGDMYENIDYVKMWTPANVRLTKRDRITNIRGVGGSYWVDEEFTAIGEPPKATTFNVNGVTPLFDAFNRHVENFVLLERVDNLSDGEA
jgi:hypothetical protein